MILDVLSPKDLFFLQKNFLFDEKLRFPSLLASRFSYPMELTERENFLTSDHSLGVCQALYERGGKTLRHRQHFGKGSYAVIEG